MPDAALVKALAAATRGNREHVLPPASDPSARYQSLASGSHDHSADDYYYLNPPGSVRASPLQPLETLLPTESLLSPDRLTRVLSEQDCAPLLSPQQLLVLARQRGSQESLEGRLQQTEPAKRARVPAESPPLRPVAERNRANEMYAPAPDTADQRELYEKLAQRKRYDQILSTSPTGSPSSKLALSPVGKRHELHPLHQSGVIKLKECGKVNGGKKILKLNKNNVIRPRN